ncbi:MAG: thiamine phosphate synthase [Prolixibacteraceae bacterium]|nr:thiamine phosphate synthase [Prolixibacteraceae bacterium]MBN2649468.1 thiamine phosphate synthase [Prolixibacteraceae bacterium]
MRNMHLIAITHPEELKNESEIINTLFSEGLPCLHLRKPGANINKIELLLEKIDKRFYNRVMINDYLQLAERYNIRGIHFSGQTKHLLPVPLNGLAKSCSCHSFNEIGKVAKYCNYVFLSPVFNSISKKGYKAAFNFDDLVKKLSHENMTKIIALGGILPDKIAKAKQLGFDGVAVLGGLWDETSTLEKVVSNFKRYKKQMEICDLM